MILDLHHRHSAEGSTEVQGNAPLLSVTRGEKGTPESSYPLSHIRQDERAGRDSQEAFAQRASEKGKGAGRCPATTTAALLDRSRPPIREDQIPGPIPRTRHQDAGPSVRIPHSDNRGATRPGPSVPSPRELAFRVPSFPSRHQPRKNQPTTEPATTTAALLDRSRPPIREDQIPGPTPRARHQDAGWRIHRQAERSLTATTAKLLEQVPSNRTHGEPALFGIQVPSFPSRHQPRRINPPPTERPNPPREDQGPSPPAGPHAFTCSRPGVTFPSPPCNRNST